MDRNVEYILEVARCGGITRAAENLFITPSALSKYVIALEDQLQVNYFTGSANPLFPLKRVSIISAAAWKSSRSTRRWDRRWRVSPASAAESCG